MLASGLRLEEAAKLRPCDIREEQGVFVFDVNTDAGLLKTASSARLVPIHSALLPSLQALAATQSDPKANLWGLKQDRGGRWSESLSKRLNTRIDAAGIQERGLVTESLRNTFAFKLRAEGVPLSDIAELLGHSSSRGGHAMTARYAGRAELEKLQQAAERLPLAPLLAI